MRKIFLLILSLITLEIASAPRDTISLRGDWNYTLNNVPPEVAAEGIINLPNTLDNSRKSVYNSREDNPMQWHQEFKFEGKARYKKTVEIPYHWQGKNITLFLERTKPSQVYIDGIKAGFKTNISSSQKYDLTEFLFPGRHEIEIVVNNKDSLPHGVAKYSNASSDGSQTNWNGILGQIFLEAKNPFYLSHVRIEDREIKDSIPLTVFFKGINTSSYELQLKHKNEVYKVPLPINTDSLSVKIKVASQDLWSPRNPQLHDISLEMTDSLGNTLDFLTITTGFRTFSTKNSDFLLNNEPLFLRGTINSGIFPETTYSPTDLNSWRNYFSVLKEYGFNHVRFNSWTPPEAAFIAADETGVMILAELPVWGEIDRDLVFTNRFLSTEVEEIMANYNHHPSFVMFSPGNELWGDVSLMGEYMDKAKSLNPRILATHGSNVYLGLRGPLAGDDFYIGSRLDDTSNSVLRGSFPFSEIPDGGYLNSHYPSSNFTFPSSEYILEIPVISHEVGQYQTYPDFSIIDKFKGNLKPDNLILLKQKADESGLSLKEEKFKEASGKWAAKLYRTEIETALRSPLISGFQINNIQDNPGQAVAMVGILDPFMESKGIIDPEDWKLWNDDVVILAEFPKFTFSAGEDMEVPIKVANYSGKPNSISKILWRIGSDSGIINVEEGRGIIRAGKISLKAPFLKEPRELFLELEGDNGIKNRYNFFVYPQETKETKNIIITRELSIALQALEKGKKVLYFPDSKTVYRTSIDPLFVSDFWNFGTYNKISKELKMNSSSGTLGLSIKDMHPSLKLFPTDKYTDWQWYEIIKNSRPLIIDRLPKSFEPIVEVIDNAERSYPLALVMEFKVGKGKVMVVSVDPEKLQQSIEGKWFLQSIKEYMESKEFQPELELTPEQFVNLITKPTNSRIIKEAKENS